MVVSRFIEAVKQIKAMGISLLIAESNLASASRVADRLYAIDRGEIIFDGSPQGVFARRGHHEDPRLAALPIRRRRAGEDMGGMVPGHEPLAALALEDIGGHERGHRDISPQLREDVLRAGDQAVSPVTRACTSPRLKRISPLPLKMASQDCRTASQPSSIAQPGCTQRTCSPCAHTRVHLGEVRASNARRNARGFLDLRRLVVRRHVGHETITRPPRARRAAARGWRRGRVPRRRGRSPA